MTILTTARLRLEPQVEAHLDGLNAVNADPEVMRYVTGQPETREETLAGIRRVQQRWADVGYSWFAFVERDTGEVIGSGCLQNLRRELVANPDPGAPLELGWRLRQDRWGRGLASEAAEALAAFAFDQHGAQEVYAVCEPENVASSRVMERLGMHALGLQRWYGREMATYAISAAQWRDGQAARDARASARQA